MTHNRLFFAAGALGRRFIATPQEPTTMPAKAATPASRVARLLRTGIRFSGRPRGLKGIDDSDRRTAALNFRLTIDELYLLDAEADRRALNGGTLVDRVEIIREALDAYFATPAASRGPKP